MTKDHETPENHPDAADKDAADRGLTSAALRHGLDHGRGGDKVNFSDPAAAPLGTDDEAAGTPPTQEQIRMAAAAELGPLRPKAGPQDHRTPAGRAGTGLMGSRATWLAGLAAALAVIVVILVL